MNVLKSLAVAVVMLLTLPVGAQAVTLTGQPSGLTVVSGSPFGVAFGLLGTPVVASTPNPITWTFQLDPNLTESYRFQGGATVNAASLFLGGLTINFDGEVWNVPADAGTTTSRNFADIILAPGQSFDVTVGWQTFPELGDVDFTLFAQEIPTIIPLPASAWLFLSALAGMGLLARRRTSA